MPGSAQAPVQAKVGDKVECRWSDGLWYSAKVIADRQPRRGARQVRVHYAGTRTARYDEWKAVTSRTLSWPRTEEQRQLDELGSLVG